MKTVRGKMTSASNQPAEIEETPAQQVLRKMSENHIRLAVVGNVDAGKSTLISSLTHSILDDGRGSARAQVTKHKHELLTGRTSTITTHLFGMDLDAKTILNKDASNQAGIALKASYLVSIMDLAGHEKYLKTTIAGVARGMADYALLLVNAAQSPTNMTMHHLKLCASMGIPVIVVMTKVDRCPSHVFRTTKQEILRMLRSPDVGLKPYTIDSTNDIDLVKIKMTLLTPILSISCVTGQGMDILRQLLAALPQRRRHAEKQRNKPFEYLVEDIYQVPGVGTVLSGFVTRGEWKKGEPIHIGPLTNGTTIKTTPKSAHVAQTNVDHVWAGHYACFAIPKLHRVVRGMLGKGMVALKHPVQTSTKFTADVILVKGKNVTILKDHYESTIHMLHNKVSARVTGIQQGVDNDSCTVIRQDDRATMTFELKRCYAYVRPGMRIIMRDGHVRGYGVVVATESEGPFVHESIMQS